MRTDDPWYDALASGPGDHDAPPAATAATLPPRSDDARTGAGEGARTGDGQPANCEDGPETREAHAAAVYVAVQRSEAFQQVRRRYRRFVAPVSVAFLAWYLAYLVTATAAPELMSRPLAGVFNVAMAAGLAQFASTFLLTWAYVRHARLRRDGLALDLRWETEDMARAYTAPAPRTAMESMR
ncbi:DUF485 domain-containing protein [Streptomyces sp. WMMB 322]|uniref:DUF485 domain-containing protein n=1 Tax=Streptomyces sp. WMMB 322 TaxID=1286821 RepID=UPI0006E24FDE|nr:DUF485 domain-containing protein [Streptomyces sp. WMMB 322]SCK50078.1 Uncharacterized membrane protein, DUF485 family [Streptomyces sp. WMMB 322]